MDFRIEIKIRAKLYMELEKQLKEKLIWFNWDGKSAKQYDLSKLVKKYFKWIGLRLELELNLNLE